MKSKKKIIIPIAVVLVLALAAFWGIRMVEAAGPQIMSVSATPLEKMDLQNTVSVTGTVKSQSATNIYSTLAYQIEAVNVEVGDEVKEGDVLCELDTSKLQAQINQNAAAASAAQAKANHALAVAQNQLDTEKFNQEKNYDSKLQQAESAVESAEREVNNAKLNVHSAALTTSSLRSQMQDYRDQNGGYSGVEFDVGYDELRTQLRQAEVKVDQADLAVKAAEQGLADAKENLRIVKMMNKETLVSAQDQVNTARLNTNFSDSWMAIEELRKDINEAVVKSPVTGTITAVLATEGGSGQGLLFVIEDTEHLKIVTKIKEYDFPIVTVGQNAVIKSDGTGEEEYIGLVSKIAPTALKSATGETVETTDVQFATDVGVTSSSTGLRIGMNARIEIVTEEKKNVFAVPYDAVFENDNGEKIVYVARPAPDAPAGGGASTSDSAVEKMSVQTPSNGAQKTGGTVAVAVPVTTGMETDLYIEISSTALKEGDMIISEPSSLTDGMPVSVTENAFAADGAQNMPGGPNGPGVAVRMG